MTESITSKPYVVILRSVGQPIRFIMGLRERKVYELVHLSEASRFKSFFAACGIAREFGLLPADIKIKRTNKSAKPKTIKSRLP